jgi:hypothetical protein
LASEARILDVLDADLRRAGLVDARLPPARLVFLAIVSRMFDRPVSVVVKGPSSAGKSWLVERVLEKFPASAFYELTSMSEKSLVYDTEPLVHRMLVVGEAVAIAGTDTGSLLRELLSSGHIRHVTVETAKDGSFRSRVTERDGPTGLISTTTELLLHPETETRLFAVTVGDSKAAQRAIQKAWGRREAGLKDAAVDHDRWHKHAEWLSTGQHDVVVPYGERLGVLIPTTATRLQRDLIGAFALVRAHALLHRGTRDLDGQGRIVATLDDYAVVRELIEPIISVGVQATVKEGVRKVVEKVASLPTDEVSQADLVTHTGISKGGVSRFVGEAVSAGWLINNEDRRGQPARLRVGDSLPEEGAVLPDPEDLA